MSMEATDAEKKLMQRIEEKLPRPWKLETYSKDPREFNIVFADNYFGRDFQMAFVCQQLDEGQYWIALYTECGVGDNDVFRKREFTDFSEAVREIWSTLIRLAYGAMDLEDYSFSSDCPGAPTRGHTATLMREVRNNFLCSHISEMVDLQRIFD